MSPRELAGKSFGRLRDRRNSECDECGRGFRNYEINQNRVDKIRGRVKLICPHCGAYIETVSFSKIQIVS